MSELGALALRLAEATDIPTAAERLAEHLQTLVPDAAARVYLMGPGDRCGACPRAEQCPTQQRCFHLEAGLGTFARPSMLDQRIPPEESAWQAVHAGGAEAMPAEIPDELRGPNDEDGEEAPGFLLLPLEAGGETVGVVGVRFPEEHRETVEAEARVGTFLTATAIRLLRSLTLREARRIARECLRLETAAEIEQLLTDRVQPIGAG